MCEEGGGKRLFSLYYHCISKEEENDFYGERRTFYVLNGEWRKFLVRCNRGPNVMRFELKWWGMVWERESDVIK